jgi:hypothetical protein
MNKEVLNMFDQIKNAIINSESIYLYKQFLIQIGYENVKLNQNLTFKGILNGELHDNIKVNDIFIDKNSSLIVNLNMEN